MAMLEIIKSDGSVDTDYPIPDPSALTWGLKDISGSSAGRTNDSLMHKERKAQKRTLTLSWNGPTPAETAQILRAFNPEYIKLRYDDALTNSRQTRTFYVGDRSAPVSTWQKNNKLYTNVSFEVIER